MSTASNAPTRANTGASETGHIEDPSAAASLLIERLNAWKHACGYLESYITAVEKMQKAQSKEHERVLKSVSDPLRESHHFDQNVGGVAGFFENIRSNTQAIANSHIETEKNLKGSVLPVLERLHAEIKNKNKELTGGAAKGSKAVDKARSVTQKHLELLGQNTASHDSTGGKIEPSHDPYVLQRGIYHRLNKQILEENNNRQDLLSVQASFQQFEGHVIKTLQEAMNAYLQVVVGQVDQERSLYTEMGGTLQKVPLDFEWKGFLHRNTEVLIDPNQAPRSMETVSFPNQNHTSTKPLIEGSLERKSRLTYSYSAAYYVVTPSKYLHEFKDTDNYRKDPAPELSLYLPDCTIGAANGNKFNVKGKDTSKGRVGSSFSTTHELAFKAHSAQDAEAWSEIIRKAAGTTKVEPYAGSEPNSPATSDKRQTSTNSTTSNPTVQTQGLTQGSQPASASTGTPGGVATHDMVASPTSASTTGTAGAAAAGEQKLPVRQETNPTP